LTCRQKNTLAVQQRRQELTAPFYGFKGILHVQHDILNVQNGVLHVQNAILNV